MFARALIATIALCTTTAAFAERERSRSPGSPLPVVNAMTETKIRNMSEYIEAVVDPRRGVYIQGYTGQWYYARVRQCPRLNRFARLRFEPSPGGDFDNRSMIRADGWRCFVDSVVEVEGLPRRDS